MWSFGFNSKRNDIFNRLFFQAPFHWFISSLRVGYCLWCCRRWPTIHLGYKNVPLTTSPADTKLFIAELSRARSTRSEAPWVTKFGKLSIRENLVMTLSTPARPPIRTHTSCKPMSKVTIDLAQLDYSLSVM